MEVTEWLKYESSLLESPLVLGIKLKERSERATRSYLLNVLTSEWITDRTIYSKPLSRGCYYCCCCCWCNGSGMETHPRSHSKFMKEDARLTDSLSHSSLRWRRDPSFLFLFFFTLLYFISIPSWLKLCQRAFILRYLFLKKIGFRDY